MNTPETTSQAEPAGQLPGVGSATGSHLPPDWQSLNWRDLRKGEIIEVGDWVDACNDGWRDPPKWMPANCIGEPAPDPQYPSHRTYRRILANMRAEPQGGHGDA